MRESSTLPLRIHVAGFILMFAGLFLGWQWAFVIGGFLYAVSFLVAILVFDL